MKTKQTKIKIPKSDKQQKIQSRESYGSGILFCDEDPVDQQYPPIDIRSTVRPRLPQKLQGTKVAGRPDYDYSHPDEWPRWLRGAQTEGAGIQILPNGDVVWLHGTFHDGIWMGGTWMGGTWRDGIWLGGNWVEGRWCMGEWREGNFLSGIWWDGIFREGTFSGLWRGGLWMGGTFNGYWQRTQIPPPPYVGR